MSNSNSTCFAKKAPEKGPSLFQHGNLVFQAHHVGWIVTGFFTIVATITSLWLVNKHLQWYTNKQEQRYIVRLLFMVPIYAIISFASYLFWDYSTPLLLIRDGYESTVLTAFFYLLLTYLSPSPDEQRTIFLKVGLSKQADREARKKKEKIAKWVFPLQFIKTKPADGLYFLQMMKWGVLQYCVIRPTTTLAAVILNYVGWYCEDSLSPRWGHVYITLIVSVSVSIAMYCLIQLYVPISGYLKEHKPLLKLFAVKAVVFLTFWQATGLSLLSMTGIVKNTQYMTADDINTGLAAILETFEMMLFAFLHVRAFSYKPYKPPEHPSLPPPTRTLRLRSLGHAFDFRETFREIKSGLIYITDRIRGVEPRPDMGARRVAVMENAFGRSRLSEREKNGATKGVEVVEEVDVDIGGERQWLGVGDDYAYGLAYASRKERSDGLEEAIEKELVKRGVDIRKSGLDGQDNPCLDLPVPVRRRSQRPTSWWRGIYNRISQSGADVDEGDDRPERHHRRVSRYSKTIDPLSFDYDDAPPPPIFHTLRESRISQQFRDGDRGVGAHSPPVSYREVGTSYPPVHIQAPIKKPLPSTPQDHSLVPPLNQTDTLFARVFPEGSHAVTSTELGSSATSQSTHIHLGVPHVRLTNNAPVVIVQGNDPSRSLAASPVSLQSKGQEVSANAPRTSSPIRDTATDFSLNPVASSLVDLPQRSIRPSHRRESAGHTVISPGQLHASANYPRAGGGHPFDVSFDPMSLYTAEIHPSVMDQDSRYPPLQRTSNHPQIAPPESSSHGPRGVNHHESPRLSHSSSNSGNRLYQRVSAPPSPVSSVPTVDSNRRRSRHSFSPANGLQLTIPSAAMSSPPRRSSQGYSPVNRIAASHIDLPDDPSERFKVLTQLTNSLPSTEARPLRTRRSNTDAVNVRTPRSRS